MCTFDEDFYGHEMRVIVLGYIRPEYNYTSKGSRTCQKKKLTVEALIEDIKMDMKVASESLKRVDYSAYKTADFWNV
jgi:riboflavin kinase